MGGRPLLRRWQVRLGQPLPVAVQAAGKEGGGCQQPPLCVAVGPVRGANLEGAPLLRGRQMPVAQPVVVPVPQVGRSGAGDEGG